MKPKTKPGLTLARPSEAKSREEQRELTFEGPEARLNVTLPVQVHARVKVRAAERRQTIRQYILTLLEKDGIDMRV
jgi:hypothetical protein